VLQDYPKYAINVEKGEVLYQVNINREPVIIVPYKIKWNYNYVRALNEVLSITQDGKSREVKQETIFVSHKDPNAFLLGTTDSYYFNDVQRVLFIKRTFVNKLYVHVKFKNNDGRIIKSGCDDGTHLTGPNITDPFRIDANQVIDDEMQIVIKTNLHKMSQIDEVEVSVSESRCTIID
jgi:hypothetical protein